MKQRAFGIGLGEPVDQGAGDIRALPVFGQPEEGPGAFPETLDEAGFGQEL